MTDYYYNELDVTEPIRISDAEILQNYYACWRKRMIAKFGKETVDTQYTKQDCIADWVIINWAWKADEKKETNDPPL